MRYLVLVIGICGVASAALFARYGLAAGESAADLSAWRLTIAALALILWSAPNWRRFGLPSSGDIPRLAFAGFFLALHFATWIASLQYISVARSTLLVATAPLWAGIAGLFIPRLRPKKAFWLGLAVALAGTALFVNPQSAIHDPQSSIGELLAVAGAICIVPYLLLSQDAQTKIGTLRTITWIYSSAAASLLLYLLATASFSIPNSRQAWIAILGMAGFAQLVGHSSLNWCLKHFSAAEVATATLLEPVFAAALAWLILAEGITPLQAVGGAILLAGVAVSLRAEPQPAAEF